MKYPLRADYPDFQNFMKALKRFYDVCDVTKQQLVKMYNSTSPFSEVPKWPDDHGPIKHVAVRYEPGIDHEFERFFDPVFDALSNSIVDGGFRVVRIHHGQFSEEGLKLWGCWAELESDTAKAEAA